MQQNRHIHISPPIAKNTIFEGLLLPNSNRNNDAKLHTGKLNPRLLTSTNLHTTKPMHISNTRVYKLLPSVGNQNNCLPIPLTRQKKRETQESVTKEGRKLANGIAVRKLRHSHSFFKMNPECIKVEIFRGLS